MSASWNFIFQCSPWFLLQFITVLFIQSNFCFCLVVLAFVFALAFLPHILYGILFCPDARSTLVKIAPTLQITQFMNEKSRRNKKEKRTNKTLDDPVRKKKTKWMAWSHTAPHTSKSFPLPKYAYTNSLGFVLCFLFNNRSRERGSNSPLKDMYRARCWTNSIWIYNVRINGKLIITTENGIVQNAHALIECAAVEIHSDCVYYTVHTERNVFLSL